MNGPIPRILLIWLSSLVLLMAACQPMNLVDAMAEQQIDPATTEAAVSEPTLPVELPEELLDQASPEAGKREAPLRFIFPTPAPPPVSAWRPPLYDVPWALGPYDHFYFNRPIAADEVNWPLADYRYGDFFPDTEIVHTGIDIDATRGTTVIAAGPGRVTWAGYGLYLGGNNPEDPYGLAVTIRHDFGHNGRHLYTVYAHMDRIDVEVGDIVQTGDPLGIVGNTGNTTGPHLHFEVRVETNSFHVSRNPELWLAPPQGWGVLVGRLTQSDGRTPIRKLDVYVQSKSTGQTWSVRTYGPTSVNSDDYYRENLVLSDLPAGEYTVWFKFNAIEHRLETTIAPGAIRYFTFQPKEGFETEQPAAPPMEDWLTEPAHLGNP